MSIKVTISNPNVQPISTIESTKEKTAVKNGMKVQVITPKTKASNKKRFLTLTLNVPSKKRQKINNK